ncbi:hypothetical protein F2P44_18030 [Massilia sp. CCM 8695]|uniref:DUF2059 domain-containing protein n=1 Tax=Massilia frigida TaxID=2609281 RepID=A0ABX0NG80_9BURK|nr:hypothetical protein [Massilia frigida]NHZ81158.1 hypothetical protein [Massilia frigida]
MIRLPALQRFICAALFSAAVLPTVASCAEPDELTTATQRFLGLFPASEMLALNQKMVLQIAVNMGSKVRPEFVKCMNAAIEPSVFDDASLKLAKRNFKDVQRLKEINEFMQSAAGIKYRRHALKVMETGLKQLEAGEAIRDAKPAAFTAEEMGVIQAFGARPSYAEFSRFSADVQQELRADDLQDDKLWKIRVRCDS